MLTDNLNLLFNVLVLKDLFVEFILKFLKPYKMTRLLLVLVLAFSSLCLLAQNYPIAVDDYADVQLGDSVTVYFLENDYHPENLTFGLASQPVHFTDSTFTFYVDYEDYYNLNNDTLRFVYGLVDENGNYDGNESQGYIYLRVKNNNYYDFLDHNNIKARIQASGLQFWSGPSNSINNVYVGTYEFPKGSGKSTIFNSSLWIGGLDDVNQLHLSAERYRQTGIDYWTGPLSIEGSQLSIDTEIAIDWQKVWKLTSEEIVYHKLHYYEDDYVPIDNIATWPAHGDTELNQTEYLAPFVDVDGDSTYIPLNGDYPLIRGEQCIYFIINDQREHTESDGLPLGLEIHGMAYEFYNNESSTLNNTVFFSYKIFNRSSLSFHDTYVGLFTDFDIGYASDDYIGCDVERGAYYGYNGNPIDGNSEPESYGDNPPAQGMVILGGPLMDANGIDDPDGECDESINGVGFGDNIADNERYGMKKFLYFNNDNNIQGDPADTEDYYNYLKSIWKDGTAMEYGGNGHVSSGAYGPAANFMFPGLTDPCFWGTNGEEPYGPIDWTEISAENEPGDRRGLSVMGPFTFEPGSMERVDIAYVSAFKEGEQTAVETLMDHIDLVKEEYYEDPTYFGYQWLDVNENKLESLENKLFTYPNPVTNVLNVSYQNATNNNVNYKLLNVMGKVLFSGEILNNEIFTIDLSKLKSGIYVLTINDENISYSTKVIKN